MKFGRLEDIREVDFSLPPQDPISMEYLQFLKTDASQAPEITIGAPIWGHKEWIGKIYPKGVKPGEYLRHYARFYDTVELNTTYYRVPTIEMVQRWKSLVGPEFKFCPKVPQAISHSGNLQGPGSMLAEFINAIRFFEENLGTTFLQLAPRFGPDKIRSLERFLTEFPNDLPLAVEFRHPAWFEQDHIFQLLRSFEIATVITDASGARDVVHSHITAPFPFIRFAGNRLHPTDYTRIDAWVDRIKSWMDAGLKQLSFFVHEPDETFSPDLIFYLKEQLNEKCGLELKNPPLIAPGTQGTLF